MKDLIGIVWNGYEHFGKKFSDRNTDIIGTHLFFDRLWVIKGEEAARVFYDQSKFERKGATPKRFQKTLFGVGGVQSLDAEAHQKRKQLFMQVMNPESLKDIETLFIAHWQRALGDWEKVEQIELFSQVELLLMRTACQWAGVRLKKEEEKQRARQMSAIIDSSAAVGARHRKGRKARKNAEAWIEELIEKQDFKDTSVFGFFVARLYKKDDSQSKHIIAVEILNLLRPIVAVARYIVFSAKALYEHPQYVSKIRTNKEDIDLNFVQEVRRFYPFFPVVAAKASKNFSWHNREIKKGQRVLLDLYSTNHDKKIWKNPDVFDPERFGKKDTGAYDFIPQGGGDHHKGHRCAGEWITIRLTRAAVNQLVSQMMYRIPPQNLKVRLTRMPAIVESRFLMEAIKKTG